MFVPYPSILRLKALQARLCSFHIGFDLCENHFSVHDFRSRFTQRIHLAYPFHRIINFELFGYTLEKTNSLSARQYPQGSCSAFRLSAGWCKTPFYAAEYTASTVVSPYAYRLIFFGWQGKMRQVIVPL